MQPVCQKESIISMCICYGSRTAKAVEKHAESSQSSRKPCYWYDE